MKPTAMHRHWPAILALALLALVGTGPVVWGAPADVSAGAAPLAPASYTVILYPVADSYVDQGMPTTNYGGSNLLLVSLYGESRNQQYLLARFDLSSIPAGATIESATFQAKLEYSSGRSIVSMYLIRLTENWSESTVTWDNRPSFTPVTDFPPSSVGSDYWWYSWNATPLVTNWMHGAYPNYGLGIMGPASGDLYSRGFVADPTVRPILIVTYLISAPPTSTPTATAPLPHTSTPTRTPTSTRAHTSTPTRTPTTTPSQTATTTSTPSPTATETPTPSPTATETSTPSPTATETPTPTGSPTATGSPTPSPTATARTPTVTPTATDDYYKSPTPTRTPTEEPPLTCRINTGQQFDSPAPHNVPAPGDSPTCAVAPAGSLPCECGQGGRAVSAVDKPPCCGECGWNFYEWKGSCGGASGQNPVVNAACPHAGACDVIAVWHRPLLGVSSTPARNDFCASKQNNDKVALSFEVCASALADWTVGSLKFQATGSGKDDQEIEKIKLTFDGKTSESKYTSDNGTIVFAVGADIEKGKCKPGSLTYTFKQLTCPMCEDPVRKTGCKDAKDFSVTLPAANVTAAAKGYPRHLVIGSASGGPLTLQCIKNTNTSKRFYEIQRAIDDAATQNGHTIEVCPGTYTENVNVTKELTIRSTDGWMWTTVQAAAGSDHVFEVTANKTTIQGFTVERASGAGKAGVYLGSAAAAAAPVTLTDEAASPAAGVKDCKVLSNLVQNNHYGVFIDGASKVQIGGPATGEGNRIRDNNADGVRIAGEDATENRVQGNAIGTYPWYNNGSGVWIGDGASKNTVGGTDVTPGAACANSCNTIADNKVAGVTVAASAGAGNAILGNSIYSNLKLGIDLGGDGWTRNDQGDGDGDDEANNLQNFPVLAGAAHVGARTVISGSLSSTPTTRFRLEFFENPGCDPSGILQGKDLIHAAHLTTNAAGHAAFTYTVNGQFRRISATATRLDASGQPPDTSEFSPPDIQITGIEVNQAIQNLRNTMWLIQEKETYVRLYIRVPDASECDLADVTAELRNSSYDPLPPINGKIAAKWWGEPTVASDRPAQDERDRLDRSLYFRLPRAWRSGEYTLVAEVNPDCRLPDADCDNNELERPVAFQPSGSLILHILPITYTVGGANLLPTAGDMDAVPKLLRMFPLAENNVRIRKEEPRSWDQPLLTDAQRGALLDALILLTPWDTLGPNEFYHGLLNANVPTDLFDGRASRPGKTAWVKANANLEFAGVTLAHELGHNLGRQHVPCGQPGNMPANPDPRWPYPATPCQLNAGQRDSYYGFDTERPNVNVRDPRTHSDFMGYGWPNWISDYIYNALYWRLRPAAGDLETAAAVGERLLVTGVISPTTTTGSLRAVYRFDNPLYSNDVTTGPYTLELQDSAGQVLSAESFDVNIVEIRESGAQTMQEVLPFQHALPYDARGTRLVLKQGSVILASRAASSHPPTVTITYPNGGEAITGAFTLAWTGSDPDGDPLEYVAQYSADGGATWEPLGVGLKATRLDVDAAQLPGGARSVVRVAASDGFHTAYDRSNSFFAVPPKGPTALILEPEDGQRYPPGMPVVLRGQAYDQLERDLPWEALAWTSDRDGALGEGEEVDATALKWGWHTITLTATDSDGMTGTDSARVCVRCAEIYLPVILR